MATISEILSSVWPGNEWRIDGDDYTTLWWSPGNSVGKPSESEIRNHSGDVDLEINDSNKKSRQQRAMHDAPDATLRDIEILIRGLAELCRITNDMRDTILPEAHTGNWTPWNNQVVQRIANLNQRILDIRNNVS